MVKKKLEIKKDIDSVDIRRENVQSPAWDDCVDRRENVDMVKPVTSPKIEPGDWFKPKKKK